MKKYLFVVSIFTTLIATSSLFAQVKNDTVRNETIIKMTKAKLGDKIILSKISTSPNKFDISTDALIKLKENNVSDTVVNIMVYKQSLIESYSDNNSANSDGSSYTFKNSGIYFKKNDKYTSLDPTLVTSSTAAIGVVAATNMAQIEGGEANYQFTETPEFYFNFSPAKKDLNKSNNPNSDNYMDAIFNSGTAVSPNEFKLLKLKVSRGKREYQSGRTAGVYGGGKSDYSIGDKYIVTFKYEKISDNTYKIILPAGLTPGEYCFVYLSNNASSNPYLVALGKNTNKVFDFGVK